MRDRMAANRPEGRRDRAAMRERWESMSEEERSAARLKREEIRAQRREKWESMSEEERAAARERKRARKHDGKSNRRPSRDEDPEIAE